jgi:hypothetical protein
MRNRRRDGSSISSPARTLMNHGEMGHDTRLFVDERAIYLNVFHTVAAMDND